MDNQPGVALDSLQIQNPTQIFGTHQIAKNNQSSRVEKNESWQPALSLLLITTLFCYGIYRYGVQLRIVLKNYWSIENTLDIIWSANREYTSFLRFSKLLFLLMISTCITTILCKEIHTMYEYFFVSVVSVVLISLIVTLLQKLLNRLTAIFSDNKATFYSVRSYSNLDVAIFAYILSPVAVITALTDSANIWMLSLLGIFYMFHIIRSFIYLQKEKFYFSQWFLYLCGVEILPVMTILALLKGAQGFLAT